MLERVPLVLVIGLVFGVTGELASFVSTMAELDLANVARVGLARSACWTVETVLVTIGLFELARRARMRTRALLLVAAGLQLVLTAWFIGRPLVELAVGRDLEALDAIYRYGSIATGSAATILAVVLAVAARTHRGALALGAFAILLMLARGWIPPIGELVYEGIGDRRILREVYWLANVLGYSLAVFGLCTYVAKDALPESADSPAASTGFRLLANALQFRIVAAVVIALLGVTMMRSVASATVILVGGPLVILVTTVVAVLGIMRAARSRIDHLPVRRLAVGGALVLWWCALQLEQVSSVAQLVGLLDYSTARMDTELARAWSVAGPLVATAGFALVGSAISTFALACANHTLREAASLGTRLFVILSTISVAIQSQLASAASRDGFLLLMFAAAGTSIAALVVFARLANQAANAIDTGPTLPVARVRDV